MILNEKELAILAEQDPSRHVRMVRVISIEGSASAVHYLVGRSVLSPASGVKSIAPPTLGNGSQTEIARYIEVPE